MLKVPGNRPAWIRMDRIDCLDIRSIDGPPGYELRAHFGSARAVTLARSLTTGPLERIADELVRGFVAGEMYAEIPQPEESG
jgi:hypothetical protein